MIQFSPIEPFDEPAAAIADYRQQAREFLVKSRQYLADDGLHQAAEKGWGAAAWMAKAVAEARGWQYQRHEEFADIINRARLAFGDERLRQLRAEWPTNCTAISTPENVSWSRRILRKGSTAWQSCSKSSNPSPKPTPRRRPT